MKIRPIEEYLLVQRDSAPKTSGGLILVETPPRDRGIVLLAGGGKTLKNGSTRPMEVKVGDKVFFDKNSGSPYKHDGKDCILLREDDVLAVIE